MIGGDLICTEQHIGFKQHEYLSLNPCKRSCADFVKSARSLQLSSVTSGVPLRMGYLQSTFWGISSALIQTGRISPGSCLLGNLK